MTIINGLLSSEEGKTRIHNPVLYLPDPDKKEPLALANIYFGQPDTDAEQPENQKRVYAIQEGGSLLAIPQPVKTSAGGVPVFNGTPVQLAIDGDYSFKVLDSSLSQKYNYPVVKGISLLEAGIVSIVEDVLTLTTGQTSVTFPNADVSVSAIDIDGFPVLPAGTVDSRGLFKETDYVIANGGSGEITLINTFPTGTLIRARQNVSTAQEDVLSGVNRVFSELTMTNAITVNFSVGEVVRIVSNSVAEDGLGGLYEVVAESTGTPDGINYINLTNLLQFRLIKTRDKFQTFVETLGTPTILSSVLTIDVNQGTVQEIELTENVSSFVWGNLNATGATTITIKFKQDAVGSHSVNFGSIKFAGGTAPTMTATALAEDIVVISTYDGGSTFYGFTAGQNFS